MTKPRRLFRRSLWRVPAVVAGLSLTAATSAPPPSFGSSGAPPALTPQETPSVHEPLTDVAGRAPAIAIGADEAPHLRLERLGLATPAGYGRQPEPVPQFTQVLAEPALWPTPPDPDERPRLVVDPEKGPHEPPAWMTDPDRPER